MRKPRVIHLDDHFLFSEGFKRCMKLHSISLFYLHFTFPADALRYITNCSDCDEKIDLVVTDFNHPGIDGYHFAREVRDIQKNSLRSQVLMLTMAGPEKELIARGIGERCFDHYFQKSAESAEIAEYVRRVVTYGSNPGNR